MNPRRPLASALAALLMLSTTPPALAGVPTDQLKVEVERVIQTLEDPALQGEDKAGQRRQRVRGIADGIFDWTETARRSLARHWQPLTDAQRQEFVRLFGDLLERSYVSKIELYGGEKVVYVSEVVDGDQALVRTKVITRQGTELPVDYRMLRRGDRWLVYDVVLEGVSLVGNYRTQFNKIIQTASFEELLAKLRAKQREVPSVELAAPRP
jgi:phospholipid transport system substrate-binding protein